MVSAAMARPLSILLLICMLLVTAALAEQHKALQSNEHDHSVNPKNPALLFNITSGNTEREHSDDFAKRWFSVDRHPPPGGIPPKIYPPAGYAWPPVCEDPNGQGPSWVRYCFRDHRSASNLYDVLMEALLVWSPAYQVSSFNIQPDPACQGYMCLCSIPGVKRDSLMIWVCTILACFFILCVLLTISRTAWWMTTSLTGRRWTVAPR